MWVRGLKPYENEEFKKKFVAPRVGAWIETIVKANSLRLRMVAPRVGAWIETIAVHQRLGIETSHPVWVRGLKHYTYYKILDMFSRTPCGCVD